LFTSQTKLFVEKKNTQQILSRDTAFFVVTLFFYGFFFGRPSSGKIEKSTRI